MTFCTVIGQMCCLGLDKTVSNYYNWGMLKHPSKMNKEGESYYR